MEINVTLSSVASIFTGISEDSIDHSIAGFQYRYIQPNNFSESGEIKEVSKIFKKEEIPASQLVKNGDVIIKRLNPNFSVVAPQITNPTAISQNLFIIRPKTNVVPEYLACLFEQSSVLSQIEHLSGTSSAIKAISAKKLAEIKIPVVSIQKQIILGELWKLNKRKKRLLLEYVEKNDQLLTGIVEKLTGSK
ncbi:MAG: hypothetical protein GX434_00605 [Peptococcaceae bacterium]|nr:hypothetical protein [Peptococcaceae bacterium]